MPQKEENILLILSSPSGAGKTTITKKIQQKYQNFKLSVSHTTRKPRDNEIEGIDYYFVTNNEFENLINKDSFTNMLKFLKIFTEHQKKMLMK